MSAGELADKVALVTGGSRGIGRAIAVELARAGAKVVFTYVANPDAARETEKAIAEAGGRGRAERCDVADHAAVEALIAAIVQQEGRLDVVGEQRGHRARPADPAHEARGLRRGDRHQPARRLERLPLRGQAHAETARRAHHQPVVGRGRDGKPRTEQLRGEQGRRRGADPLARARDRQPLRSP